MKLEDQVVSLELSKKLKELGVKQDSYFSWAERDTIDGWLVELSDELDSEDECYSAFTVAELGEMLKKVDLDYWYSYPDFRLKLPESTTSNTRSEKEADARAEMIIYLIENKLSK